MVRLIMPVLSEFKLLEKYGFKLLPYGIAKNEKEAILLAEKLGYPVAMKLISPQASHKTDVGGVKLNVKNHLGVKLTFKEFLDIAREKRLKLNGILVQKMARKGIELIIGGKRDEQFGPMIILGLGGIYVEIFRDISARLCPITKSDVEEMVNELKSHPVLLGARGKKGISLRVLEDVMLKTCKLMEKENLKELDLNPIIFDEKGADLVDVRMVAHPQG
jgi:acetyl-CoA synthetase (ADP-forming)